MSDACTDAQKSRILAELQKRHLNVEVWDELDVMDKGTCSEVISAFHRGDHALAVAQMRHLGIPL